MSRRRTLWQFRQALDRDPGLGAEMLEWLAENQEFRPPAPANPGRVERDAKAEAACAMREWFVRYLEATNPAVCQQEDTQLGPYIGHPHLAKGMTTMRLYGAITKVRARDDGSLEVHGVVSSAGEDEQGEIVRPSAMAAALPGYMQYGNIRQMHQLDAVGRAIECAVGADGKTRIVANIVDDAAIRKIKARVYNGFSIGGSVLEREAGNARAISKLKLTEISLVDRPANPEAQIELWKADRVMPQPQACWDCGTRGHTHGNKITAAQCRAQRTMAKAGGGAVKKSKQQKQLAKQGQKILARPIVPDSSDMAKRAQGYADFVALYRAGRVDITHADPRFRTR
jgi:hypothetical protein